MISLLHWMIFGALKLHAIQGVYCVQAGCFDLEANQDYALIQPNILKLIADVRNDYNKACSNWHPWHL